MTHTTVTIWLLLALLAFFAPTWLARPGHRISIFIINAGVGWTGLGWLLALYKARRTWEGR
jgi:hypothetical protein